jgi:hypothetical protein
VQKKRVKKKRERDIMEMGSCPFLSEKKRLGLFFCFLILHIKIKYLTAAIFIIIFMECTFSICLVATVIALHMVIFSLVFFFCFLLFLCFIIFWLG